MASSVKKQRGRVWDRVRPDVEDSPPQCPCLETRNDTLGRFASSGDFPLLVMLWLTMKAPSNWSDLILHSKLRDARKFPHSMDPYRGPKRYTAKIREVEENTLCFVEHQMALPQNGNDRPT